MTPKAEKAVRELLAIRIKYGEQPFAEALGALRDGSAFADILDVAEAIQAQARTKLRRIAKRPDRTPLAADTPRADLPKSELVPKELPDRDRLVGFLSDVSTGRKLRSARTISRYLALMNAERPTARQTRPQLSALLAEKLLKMNQVARRDYLLLGERIDDSEESSLQSWSDLIVRG